MTIESKLPHVGTTIFTVMSALAEQHKAINLSQGFPNFDVPDELKRLVNIHIQRGVNQYAPMPGVLKLREVLAEKIQTLYRLNVNPQTEITITAGGAQGIFSTIAAFIRPNDEVILIEPAYDSYAPGIQTFGGKVVPYRLAPPQYKIDWMAFGKLITDKTKMIIINTPNNPTSKTLTINDLETLNSLTKDTDIIVLSDEVYEHLVYDHREHASVMRLPELFSRSVASFSFGKTFHATGWRVGYVVAPEYLMREFRKVHQFNVFSINTPTQHALADFLEDEDNYLYLSDFYQAKRDFFLSKMSGSRFSPLKSEGTYFQLFNYSQISDKLDTEFCKWLTTDIGVAAIPVSVFYTEGAYSDEKIIRLCFAKTDNTLEKAAEKLCQI
ncbi:MAG: aminotransferase class I/II-fold pyridoxal phosphate-dependent enzyme [Saprospiraceae bacterium]|nr:aminotransferase class I/II-fold pyridoxal phosphate-dependent enzyme [Saprospiraceae bacterium]